MTLQEVMAELEKMGDENTKKTLMRHGAKEPFFGVKVADLKKILKKTKKNHELSLQLFQTGNSDAMYLAGLMADEKLIGKNELNDWVKKAYWSYLSEYAVPWVAAETDHGFELGMEWIDAAEENIKAAGWATLASFASYQPDEKIDTNAYSQLLDRVEKSIHLGDNREKYAMNGFIIATASYIPSLTEKAKRVADSIGIVMVDMNGTACNVPLAKTYIKKVEDKGKIGSKKKSARC